MKSGIRHLSCRISSSLKTKSSDSSVTVSDYHLPDGVACVATEQTAWNHIPGCQNLDVLSFGSP